MKGLLSWFSMESHLKVGRVLQVQVIVTLSRLMKRMFIIAKPYRCSRSAKQYPLTWQNYTDSTQMNIQQETVAMILNLTLQLLTYLPFISPPSGKGLTFRCPYSSYLQRNIK